MSIDTTMVVELRVASANFCSGGIDRGTGSKERWEKIVSALRVWQPHIVLCQEMSARPPVRLQAHLWATARAGHDPGAGSAHPALTSLTASLVTHRYIYFAGTLAPGVGHTLPADYARSIP